MSDSIPGSSASSKEEAEGFRWQSYFQRSTEPLFLLNRQRRLLFANRAWEALTGFSARDMRGRACKRRAPAADADLAETLQNLLAPPPEVLQGKPARTRRLVPHTVTGAGKKAPPAWWDVTFFPFNADSGLLGILGKISVVPREGLFENQPLPEKIVALRERLLHNHGLEHIIAQSTPMKRVVEQVRLAGGLRTPVLLAGERGTGKRWLARCIHQLTPRREGIFAAVDCARLPQAALAEALFGEGGPGRRAQPGTLYLHELQFLPREMQDRLCRVADGWSDQDSSGPVLLAGISADPEQEVRSGRLLADLHCRLSTLTIAVPSLAQRADDLAQLAAQLLARAGSAAGKNVAGLTDEAMKVLAAHRWPGNIAELYRVLLAACLRAKGERLDAGDLPFYLRSVPAPKSRPLPLDSILEQVERRLLILAMRHTRNNKTEAAELLSIWRARLIRRLEALGIDEGAPPGG